MTTRLADFFASPLSTNLFVPSRPTKNRLSQAAPITVAPLTIALAAALAAVVFTLFPLRAAAQQQSSPAPANTAQSGAAPAGPSSAGPPATTSPTMTPALMTDDQKALAAKPTPRLADGHPDLNGIWYQPLLFLGAGEKQGDTLKYVPKANPAFVAAIKAPPPQYAPSYKPELLAKVQEYNTQQVKLDPGFFCKPPGVPRIGPPQKIIQTPTEAVFLYSDLAGNFWRIVPTDGRPHRTDADTSYFGDSVGHWEGDTLVVDVNNFNDDTWLGDNGLFHSDALHVTERLTRKGDTILYEAIVDDPKVFTKPWTMKPHILTPIKEPLDEAPPCVEQDAPNMTDLEHHGNPR
jgi:hypothetical protein